MAATRKPYDAINLFARPLIRHMSRIEEVSNTILDLACQELWMEAPWRWTIFSAESLTLVSNTQDLSFTSPTTGPVGLLHFVYSYVTDGVGASRPIAIVPTLPVDVTLKGQPTQISFISGTPAKMRLFPCPPVITNTTKLISLYKATAPIITRTNMHTAGTLVMDDEWFHVYVALVLFYAYRYSDDPRQDAQYKEYMLRVERMKQREKMPFWLARDPETGG